MIALREISIRVKLAALTGIVITVVVLGQAFQTLATESLVTQEQISLRARLLMVSVAGAMGPTWTDESVPGLEPYVERLSKDLDIDTLALVGADGEVVAFHGMEPTPAEVRRVVDLRLRTVPRSLSGLSFGQLNLMVATPIVQGHDARGYLFCAFHTHELAERMRALVFGTIITALFWVAVGAGLMLWVTGRITRPLVTLSEALSLLGKRGYELPPGGRAEGEIGIVQDRLADLSTELAEERRRVDELTGALRHQVEVVSADLEHSAAQRQAILDATRNGILMVDPTGVVTAANDPARAFFGADVDTGGVNLWTRMVDAEQASTTAERARSLNAPFMFQTRSRIGGDGEEARFLLVRIAPMGLQQGDDDPLVVVTEDVSDRQQLEEQMMRSERLASIGTLTAGLAHQIGNALNSVKGYADLLARRMKDAEPRTLEDIDAIRNSVRSASQLMERVFLLARTRPPSDAPLLIPQVVGEALELVRVHAEQNGVRVVDRLESPGCTTWGDPNLFLQAVLNVLMNAIQAMPDGGELTVSSHCNCTGQCSVRIRDTGPGMPEEVRLRVFDPFYTTKEEGEGTGLGLPIAQRIVELHGGVMRIESSPGEGTTVELELALRRPEQLDEPTEALGGGTA